MQQYNGYNKQIVHDLQKAYIPTQLRLEGKKGNFNKLTSFSRIRFPSMFCQVLNTQQDRIDINTYIGEQNS